MRSRPRWHVPRRWRGGRPRRRVRARARARWASGRQWCRHRRRRRARGRHRRWQRRQTRRLWRSPPSAASWAPPPPDAELRRRLRAADGCVQTAANAFFEAAPSAAAAGSGGAAGGAGASGASAGAAGPSELRAAEQGGRCCVCLEAESTHAFVPCGHQCVCATCGALVRSKAPRHACCPLCKLPSKSLMRVFRT